MSPCLQLIARECVDRATNKRWTNARPMHCYCSVLRKREIRYIYISSNKIPRAAMETQCVDGKRVSSHLLFSRNYTTASGTQTVDRDGIQEFTFLPAFLLPSRALLFSDSALSARNRTFAPETHTHIYTHLRIDPVVSSSDADVIHPGDLPHVIDVRCNIKEKMHI